MPKSAHAETISASSGLTGRATRAAALALSAAMMAAALAACASSDTGASSDSGEPVRGGILRLAGSSATASESLDPQLVPGSNDSQLNSQIYERLVRLDSDFNLIPELATEWSASPDATSWTFKLREGVKFSDGSPFTAADVDAMVDRVLDPAVGSSGLTAITPYLDAGGVKVIDDATIQFDLKAANAEFPQTMAVRQMAVAKAGTAEDDVPVGTGPFVVKSFVPGESWELERNNSYWEPSLPYLDGVRYVNQADANQLPQSVMSGSQDLAGLIPANQLTAIEGNSNVQLLKEPSASFLYLVMMPTQKPFDDPRLIEALKLAVDREAIINAAAPGSEIASDTLTSRSSQFFPGDVSVPTQDIDRAKELLAEAGYPDGIDIELPVTEFPAGATNFATALAEVVAPAGFRLAVQQYDYNTYDTTIYAKAPFYLTYSAARTPLNGLSFRSVSDAYYSEGMSNEELDGLVSEAYRTVDDEARKVLVQDALRLMVEDGNQVVPAANSNLWVATNRVHGVELNSEEFLRLKSAYIS